MTNSNTDPTIKITARELTGYERMEMLPQHFGRLMLTVESSIFTFMAHLSSGYHGGYWHYYEMSNGGVYMAPPQRETCRIAVDGNGFDATMGTDAAGITACLFALSHLSFAVRDERISNHFYWLREFVLDHPEAGAILAAID